MVKILKFPRCFLWGSATSAYQIEGGIENNDWAKIYPAGRACGHYEKYDEDFDLLKSLNQNAFRLSVEWARIEPKKGEFDEKEIEHYRKVLISLKSRGIKTMVTLHHFTNPLWLAEIGGWENEKTVFYFSRFAERIFKEYSDLTDFWITINEPLVYIGESYLFGRWPPKKKNLIFCLKIIRNQIKAHKKVYELFHELDPEVKVGIAKNNQYFQPYSKSILNKLNVFLFSYFGNEYFLNKIKKELDFIGLNYYFHHKIKFPGMDKNENISISDLGWEIYPEGIYYVLKGLKKYNLPIYITENGLADSRDKLRKEFIKNHLFWVYKAINEGISVKGYFHWSLTDNFEWDKGFSPRFGLVEIDYNTLKRMPRPSAYYYSKICQTNQLKV